MQDKTGNTALIAASLNGFTPAIEILLSHTADVNIQNKKGISALIAAVTTGNAIVVKELMANGADIKLKDHNHKTAADYANELQNTEIANLLNGSATTTATSTR